MLPFDEYQKQARRTQNPDVRGIKALNNAALGLTGEAGEVADLIKKHIFHGHELDQNKIVNELGDILWYVCQAADALQVSLETIAKANITKLRHRYPEGFDSEKSKNRAEVT